MIAGRRAVSTLVAHRLRRPPPQLSRLMESSGSAATGAGAYFVRLSVEVSSKVTKVVVAK